MIQTFIANVYAWVARPRGLASLLFTINTQQYISGVGRAAGEARNLFSTLMHGPVSCTFQLSMIYLAMLVKNV
jgi:hypothetical protein